MGKAIRFSEYRYTPYLSKCSLRDYTVYYVMLSNYIDTEAYKYCIVSKFGETALSWYWQKIAS